ncbi:MAG: beta-ketoacyl-ACP synthase II [Ruminococcus sp.]|nr:beta-ketoacyl-ACP synthase II [Ruminococcus sp.]
MSRVVITGIGVISPIGNSVSEFSQSLKDGTIGFSYLGDVVGENFDVKVAGIVKDFVPENYMDKKEARRTDRFAQFAVAASKDALKDCGTDFSDIDKFRRGVMFGVGIGGLQLTLDEHTKMTEKGSNRISALYVPMMIGNMASGAVAMQTGFCGDNYIISSACASSTHALGEAFRKIKDGYLDVVIAGGAESVVNEFTLAAFNNMKALSHSSDLERASIPFDKERDGFVLGEGAAALILEEYEHAVKRGAKIYAEIAGYGATDDSYHITAPSPTGEAAARAMENAVKEAGLSPADIDYINAHGTSTGLNDKSETTALKIAFGEHASKLKVNSTKSLMGHLLGAAGAVEAAAVAIEIKEGFLHKTAGFRVTDPECDLNYCTEGTIQTEVNAALSNSLGFGGHNACICIKKVGSE